MLPHPLRHLIWFSCLGAMAFGQTATQVKLTNPRAGEGTPFAIDTVGRSQGQHDLTRFVVRFHDNALAQADNQTTWDVNPAQGYIAMTSATRYEGWIGSGVSLDTRYGLGLFDQFTIGAGDSGLAAGTPVQVNLALTLQASAQTDAFNSQTGSNWLGFSVQQRGANGSTFADEVFTFDYNVTVYEFFRRAYINGVQQFSLTTPYVNGQGNEADVYQFVIPLSGVVGGTLELGLLAGDLVPSSYTYDIGNLVEGTRQDLGNGQENFGNQFAFNFAWDLEHAAGFEGLDVTSASGFVTSASALSAVPEPSTYVAWVGGAILLLALRQRRRGRPSPRSAFPPA